MNQGLPMTPLPSEWRPVLWRTDDGLHSRMVMAASYVEVSASQLVSALQLKCVMTHAASALN